jgi:hypothetical protein
MHELNSSMASKFDDIYIPPPRPGYPLGMMFLAISLLSVLLAMAVVSLPKTDPGSILGAVIGGMVFGPTIGFVIGLFHGRRLWGGWLGAMAGGMVGPLLALLIINPAEQFGWLMLLSFVGSVLFLGLAALLRRNLVRSHSAWQPPLGDEVLVAKIVRDE